METKSKISRKKNHKKTEFQVETRELLLRAGLETLTEKGFAATGIDEMLKRAGVPKGSFYYYFKSKEAFGSEIIAKYDDYFTSKMERYFSNIELSPLARVQAFIENTKAGMEKHGYNRGCLIGRMGQEINALPVGFRLQLQQVFDNWQERFARVLLEAQQNGEISSGLDCQTLSSFFWIGWEGAILTASLEKSQRALEIFSTAFFAGLKPS